jgi:hypothetical protein
LHCADKAIEILTSDPQDDSQDKYKKAKYYYILNNRIYFITMGADDERFFKINRDVSKLEALEHGHPELWEYRFHDTLALYYTRRATVARTKDNRQKFDSYIEDAKDQINKGIDTVYSVEDLRDFKVLQKKIERETWEDIH